MQRRSRRLLSGLLGLLILLASAGPAGAHVEPTATEVPAGSYATVAFTVQHGCEASPTVKLEFQVPDELDDAVPVDKAGWTTSVDAGVITFEGGPLPADQEADFSVSFTVPEAQGVRLTFPFIQTCEVGSIDWIQTTSDAERPAPLVLVVAPDPGAPTPPSTTVAADTTTTEPPATTTTVSTSRTATEEPAADTGANPWLAVAGVTGVTIVVVASVIVLRNRSS